MYKLDKKRQVHIQIIKNKRNHLRTEIREHFIYTTYIHMSTHKTYIHVCDNMCGVFEHMSLYQDSRHCYGCA